MAGIRFTFRPGVRPLVRDELMRVAWLYEGAHPVRHDLPVVVRRHERIRYPYECRLVCGYFEDERPDLYPDGVGVVMAGGLCGRSCIGCVRYCAVTLLHELVHYEQFARGGKYSERGVERRAHALYRKMGVGNWAQPAGPAAPPPDWSYPRAGANNFVVPVAV